MTDGDRLRIVRGVHTAIYLVMSAASLLVLYAGISGRTGRWLWIALTLVAVEAAVFIASGLKCPLTAVAVRYGATPDGAYDTFFPERCTRHTIRVFGPLIALGLALNALRWFDLL